MTQCKNSAECPFVLNHLSKYKLCPSNAVEHSILRWNTYWLLDACRHLFVWSLNVPLKLNLIIQLSIQWLLLLIYLHAKAQSQLCPVKYVYIYSLKSANFSFLASVLLEWEAFNIKVMWAVTPLQLENAHLDWRAFQIVMCSCTEMFVIWNGLIFIYRNKVALKIAIWSWCQI